MYLTITVEGDSETEHVVSRDVITLTQTGNTVTYDLTIRDPITGEVQRLQRVGTIVGNTVTFTGIAMLPIEGFSFSKNSSVVVGTIGNNRIDATATVDVAFTGMGVSGTITGTGTVVFISNKPTVPAPTIISVYPRTVMPGSSISNFTVVGTNLNTTSTLSFSGSGITVNSYSTRTSSQMIASISIDSAATLGTRDVTVKNPDGQSATLTGGLTIDSTCVAPVISVHPVSTTVDPGAVVTLKVTATGTEPLSYEWYEGARGSIAKRVGTNSVQFTSPPRFGSTGYWARVRNVCGQVDSQVGTISVRAITTDTKTLSAAAGGAATTSTLGPVGPLMAGYAAGAVASGSAPYGTAVFSYAQNGVVVSEVGVPASPPTLAARFFVDTRVKAVVGTSKGTVDVLTGFAAVNPNSTTATLSLKLRDANGVVLTQGIIKLAGGAHLAKFLDQLAPDFVLPSGFVSNGLASLEITSDQPVSVLALRLTVNQRGDLLLTSTPIADLGKPAPGGVQSFPHIADGGGYWTTLILLNTSSAVETGEVRFYGNSGSPLSVRMAAGGASASRFSYSIPAGGFARFTTDGSPSTVNVGWAQLAPDAAGNAPVSAAIFSFSQGGTLVTESGVPAVTPTTRARIYVDKAGGHDTGLAVANPGSSNTRITATAFQLDGTTRAGSGQGTVDLVALGHDARFAAQVVPGLPEGFRGVLDLSSSSPFAALTLRSLTNTRGDFLITTLPIADYNQVPPSAMVFPQIAAGGGYETQMILLSGGSSSTTKLNLLGADGKAIGAFPGATTAPTGFMEQSSYVGNCAARPAGSTCLMFPDGYVWLVYDSISGWEDVGAWLGRQVRVAHGSKADYYHISTTSLIRQVSK